MRKGIKKAVLGGALALATASMGVSSFYSAIPVYASIVNSAGTDVSVGSLANVTLGVDNVDITPVRDNLLHMKYNMTLTLPAGASQGDEIGITVKNLAGLLDGSIDTTLNNGNVVNTDIKYQGEVVARIRPILSSSVNYYNESTDGNTTVSSKLQKSIEAGTSLDNYTIEILKDLPNDAKLDVFVERVVPATFVNKDTKVTGHIYVNGNDNFSVEYTLNKAKVRNPLNINKVNVDMTGNTAKLITKYKDGVRVNDHLGDIDFSLKLSPQGMDLRTGSYITITLPADRGFVFSPNSLGKSGFIKHYPLIADNAAVNDNGVYALKFDNVKFDVVDITDTTLTLKLVDGILKNNDNYEITSDTTDGLGLSLTSDATNLISDNGTTLGPVDITSKVVDSKGATLDTITNQLSVKLINGEFTRDNVLDYVNNKYKTYYVDESGMSLKDEVRLDHFADVENVAGYSLVKYSENGNVRRYVYKKLPAIPRGAKLTEYVTTDGLTLRDAIVSNKLEDSKDIAGYHIARRDENENGVKWVYEKDAQTPVMTRFVEYGTHQVLQDAVEGLDAAKPALINGYIHFLTEKLSNGDTVHYYKRQEHNHKREIQTRWVDLDGRAIKDPVNSDAMAVAGYVTGYKFVRTEEVKDNQVKGIYDIVYNHVYEKIPEADLTITTKFITEDGTILSDSLTGKKIADKQDIAGYEFVRTSSPSETEFNYIYRKIGDSSTVTKPVDNSGHVNTPNGKYTIEYLDENYERLNNSIKMNTLPDKIKTISGYTFVNSKQSGDTMYYIYKPSGKFVARFVDKDGVDIADAVTGDTKPEHKDIKGYRFAYTVTFKSGSVNYVYEPSSSTGDTVIKTNTADSKDTNKVTDTNVPAVLRSSRLSVSAVAPSTLTSGDRRVVITSGNKTVFSGTYDNQGKLTKIDVIDDSVRSLLETSTLNVTQSGDNYTAVIKDKNGSVIGDYAFSVSSVRTDSTTTTASNNVTTTKASTDTTSAQVNPVNTVVTQFVDGKGRTILKDRRSASIVTDIKIDGYTYVETYKDGDVFKALYRKDNEKVTMYQDEYGVPIKRSDVSSGFKTSAKIDGYRLKESVTNDKTKVYTYEHTGSSKPKDLLTFKFVDSKGNTILTDATGVSFVNAPTLSGYRFVEAVADGSNVKFIYADPSSITTRYKEVDGEDLIHPVVSSTDALGKRITGFDIVDRISNSNGDITYTYKRIDGKNSTTDKSTWDSSVKTSDKSKSESKSKSSSNDSDYDYVTRYEDTDGNKIASDEKSNKSFADRKEISGYKYVETKTEDDVKTYIYEKLSAEEAKKQAESQSAASSTQASNNANNTSNTTSTQPSLSNNTNNGSGTSGATGNTTINTTPDNKDVKSIKTGLGNIATSRTGMLYMLFSFALIGIVSAFTFRDKLGSVLKGFVKRIKK